MKFPKTLRNTFTTKLGWFARLSPVLGLFIVANSSGPWWWTLVLGAMWSLSAQMNLYSAWLGGWLVCAEEFTNRPEPGWTVQVDDLMDLCDEHGVPPEQVARMIWGDDDE